MTLQKSFVSKWLFIWHWDQKIAAKPAKFIWGNSIHWNSTQRSIRNGSLPNVLLFEKGNKKNQSVGEISEVFRFSWFRVLIMISYRNCERRYYNGTCDLWGKSYKSGNEEEFGVDVFLQLPVTQKPFCYVLIGRRAPCRGYQMSQEGQLDIGHF